MLLSSLESVHGHEILRQLDVVYGSTVRSKHVGRDLMAGLKTLLVVNLQAIQSCLKNLAKKRHNV